jgi:resolvase-like protein
MLEHKKKGRLRCHKRPKSREETPKEGSDSGVGYGGRYRIPLAKTIALSGSIERGDHGPIRRFMALALKAEHFCKGSNADIGQLPGEVCPRKRSFHIYTRVSTDQGLDQDFNSLDAQHESSSAYIKSQAHASWIPIRSRFDDGGYSGGSTDRPNLQRLLDDVRARKIDVIVVYKVDRLTPIFGRLCNAR